MKKLIILMLIGFMLVLTSCNKTEPLSKEAEEELYGKFGSEENIDKRIELFENLTDSNPDSKFIKPMLTRIIHNYVKNGDVKNAIDLLEDNENIASSELYNEIAWKIFENGEDLEKGSKIALKGIGLARNELKTPKKEKPENIAEKDWKDARKSYLGFILDTYGSIQKKLGDNEKALISFEESVSLTNERYPEINENYIYALIKNEKNEKAKSLLEKYIAAGTDSKNMKSLLSDVFLKTGGKKEKYIEYLSEFENSAKQKLIKKIKNEIINDPAPQFTLNDLNGKEVNLSDYKGKLVVVDFWATWCGPCLQSMPAMKKAVKKFPNVEFLFINTWERVEDKKKNATDFISQNDYPFNVLLDYKNEIVSQFKVEGIPTKFIVDKNQNIRFKSVGFSGKEDELIEELNIMFEEIQ